MSTSCEAACYDAAFCGRGPMAGSRLVDGASDINFQGVLGYLAASPAPPIDHRLVPGQNCSIDFGNYSTMVLLDGQDDCDDARKAFRLSLLGAAVATEWDRFEDVENAAKRAILELVLLAGATIDAGVRVFAGAGLSASPGGGVQYSDEYQSAVLDMCTAAPTVRRARCPGILAEITAAEPGAAQYAVIRRRFLEICCEGAATTAALEALIVRAS